MDKYLGKRLDGRYEMRELIGVGGMAYVYKAYDSVDDRTVAVKILKDEFINNEEFVRRFRNESKAIAILNHPNIVKVLDVGFGERLQYIVMEYIDGITLKEYLDQRKDIRWKEAVHFSVQILRALQHAHDKGIVHRDIKPQNIMLLSDGTIKVTDFGIARLTRNDMKATVDGNKAIGSVHYISPEQARGEITDEKTDLYSVGIMLYEILTGCLPFEADNAVSVAIMQMQSEAKAPHLINPEIPEGLEQITLKAMQKDMAKRYQSAAEMLSDFDEFKKNPSIKFEYTYMVDETPTRYVDAITRVRGEVPEQSKKTDGAAAPVPKEKKKKGAFFGSLVPISIVAIILVMLGVAVGGVVLFKNRFQKKAEMVRVEKFIGMMYAEEIKDNPQYAEDFKFKVEWEDANDPTRAVGEVFKQRPAAGEEVKQGSTITLYVNNATPDDISLNLKAEIVGKHKDEIHALLQNTGFKVSEVAQSNSEIAKDYVIGIDIELGKAYPYGKKVTMYVSSGPSTVEPIDVPPIIGRAKDEAAAFLADEGFTGIIDFKVENYTDTAFAEKGKVMAIAVGGTRQETLPEKLAPDVSITLIVSSGLQNVSVDLPWPNTSLMIDVQVNVNGKGNSELVQKFAGGIKPQYTTEKLSFNLTDHPAETPYYFEVAIRESGSGKSFQSYVVMQIDPVAGVATIVTQNDYLEGITPKPIKMVTLPEYSPVGVSASIVRADLENLGFVVTEEIEVGSGYTEGVVLRIVFDGVELNAGDSLVEGSTIVMYVSGGSADAGDVPVEG